MTPPAKTVAPATSRARAASTSNATGLPSDPNTTQLIAVSVTVDRDELSNALIELLGSSLIFSVGNTHTVVIDRS